MTNSLIWIFKLCKLEIEHIFQIQTQGLFLLKHIFDNKTLVKFYYIQVLIERFLKLP